MRRLAIFSFSFALAALLYVQLLPFWVCMVLFGVSALTGFIMLFFRRDAAKRVRLAAFGLAFGLLWCYVYEQQELLPIQAYATQEREITVRLLDDPERTDYGYRVECKFANTRMLLYLDEESGDLGIGDTVKLSAEVVDVTQNDNLYYVARDIALLGFQRGEAEVLSSALHWTDYPMLVYHSLQKKIAQIFPTDTEPFVRALLTGDTSGLSYELRNDMSITGISHIIAVSGMHVSLIVTMVMTLFLNRRRLAAGICLALMWFFAAMLGFSPSVTRAVIMNSTILLAPICKRENDAPTSLGFALLLLLIANPWSIASVSLQLSFAAVAGILIFTSPICAWIDRITRREALHKKHCTFATVVHSAAISLSTTLGATILTAPLIALYFGTVSLISVVSNLLLMPILSYTFTFGYVAVLLGFVLLPAAQGLGWLLSWGIRFVFWVVGILADLPYAAIYTESIFTVFWLITAYVILAVFCIKPCRVYVLLSSLVVTLGAALLCATIDTSQLRMTMLDVGQGQCILLESGGFTAVVDCGGSEDEYAGEDAARALLSRGKTRIDALILTHYDMDHVGGVLQLMARMEIGRLFVPDIASDSTWRKTLCARAQEQEIPIYFVTQDTEVLLSTGTLSLFAPPETSSDNDGVTVLLSVEEYDILITGDMSVAGEREFLLTHTLPDIEVLVAGHHGSKDSTSPQLLALTKPEIVLISVGENSYGHPTPQVLQRADAVGATVYRTDLNGTIIITR